MPEVILETAQQVHDRAGVRYLPRVQAQQRADGTWEGWIVFIPTDDSRPILRTERETTQSNRAALVYWASGLEPIYYEGALARARDEG